MGFSGSFSVNEWLQRLCIKFLLYWELHVLVDLVVNIRNEICIGFVRRGLLLMVVYICVLMWVYIEKCSHRIIGNCSIICYSEICFIAFGYFTLQFQRAVCKI